MKNYERDQYTVVLEDLRSQFKVFGEGLLGLNEKVDTGFKDVKRQLNSHSEMIGQLMTDMTEVKTDITILKSDVVTLKSDMTILKSDVTMLKSDVTKLKIDMGEVKNTLKQKVDRKEFAR